MDATRKRKAPKDDSFITEPPPSETDLRFLVYWPDTQETSSRGYHQIIHSESREAIEVGDLKKYFVEVSSAKSGSQKSKLVLVLWDRNQWHPAYLIGEEIIDSPKAKSKVMFCCPYILCTENFL
eukprot:Pompholyxophrys_punicea_v1_NODE_47_length_4460_cov_14.923496.p4 type:complete len:124 gc:universal NODE_47_length_4460_cov_14.923496:2038-2409(+)